ncbi:MAG: flavin monoamine oxidase family protein [Thiotrichales bacterium]
MNILDIAIVGGGLAGLRLAGLLKNSGLQVELFEARDYWGGRILSTSFDCGSSIVADLGPTWIWPGDQPLLASLIQHGDLQAVAQWNNGASLYQSDFKQPAQRFMDPSSYAGAYRLPGGIAGLVDTLLLAVPENLRHLNHRLDSLQDLGAEIALKFNLNPGVTKTVHAKQVALMLPPRLVAEKVQFEPVLSNRFLELMRNTPTWMAGHAKAVAVYPRPFWREAGLSGNAFCVHEEAVLREIFDTTDSTVGIGALSGFFGLPPGERRDKKGGLEDGIIQQLTALFGPEAAAPLEIFIKDWASDDLTATNLDWQTLNTHPAYGSPYLRLAHRQDKLYFGGSETAARFGGYLEGALESARYLSRTLLI